MTSFRVLLALALAVGCARPEAKSWFRGPGAGSPETIFSPLTLPAPNGMRTGSGAPGPDYWQQEADYAIEASLDPESLVLAGRARITYTNHSPDVLDYLWLHLEQNVFREDSIGSRVGRRGAIGARSEGEGLALHAIRIDDEPVSFQVYDTLARVELPDPLAPGGATLVFDVEWEFTLPQKVFRRFGIERVEQGSVIEVAQWFPALAVYDDVHGWNSLPYIGTGEFYTNFGDYDVELTLPGEYIVVATGELQNPQDVFTPEQAEGLRRARRSPETIVIRGADEVDDPASRPTGDGDGELTWHFKAKDVRTFAWAASDAFVLDAAGLDGVLIQSAYPKEGLPLWSESTQMLRASIQGYNERWYPYPYPVATNVNGIEGGMEYPMIVFCRARESEEGLYGVTAHEIGHNWFPMVVNTDERRHAWMDEGFNTFINYYARADWFDDEKPGRAHPPSLAPNMLQADLLPIATRPDQLPRRLFGELQYAKAGAGLVLLREQILGPERFDYAFRKYIERWAFKSPRPADFFRTIEDAAGVDLGWFWRGWFLGTGVLDQAVEKVDKGTGGRPAHVVFTNRGELVMPLVWRIDFEDGTSVTHRIPVETWYHTNRIRERLPKEPPVRSIVIDPDEGFPDVDRSNNRWPR